MYRPRSATPHLSPPRTQSTCGCEVSNSKELVFDALLSLSLPEREDALASRQRLNCLRRDPRLSATDSGVRTDYREPVFDREHTDLPSVFGPERGETMPWGKQEYS